MGVGRWTCGLGHAEDACATTYEIFPCAPELTSGASHTHLTQEREARACVQVIPLATASLTVCAQGLTTWDVLSADTAEMSVAPVCALVIRSQAC